MAAILGCCDQPFTVLLFWRNSEILRRAFFNVGRHYTFVTTFDYETANLLRTKLVYNNLDYICNFSFPSVSVWLHSIQSMCLGTMQKTNKKITSVILVLCCLLIPSMLQFTFLTKHYWGYAQMFTPFAAINVGWLLTLRPNMPTFSGLSDQGNKYIINFFIVVGTNGLFQGEILKDLKLTLALVSKTDVANGND